MRDEKKLCRLQIWDFSPEKLPEISLTDIGKCFDKEIMEKYYLRNLRNRNFKTWTREKSRK